MLVGRSDHRKYLRTKYYFTCVCPGKMLINISKTTLDSACDFLVSVESGIAPDSKLLIRVSGELSHMVKGTKYEFSI